MNLEFCEKSTQNISSISPSSAMPPKLTHKNSNGKIESIMEEMELILNTNNANIKSISKTVCREYNTR